MQPRVLFWSKRLWVLCVAAATMSCAGLGGFAEKIAGNDVTENAAPGCAADEPECLAFAPSFIADLHADTLLWGRDFRQTATYRGALRGHVDVDRLKRGQIDLQVFSVPSQTPLPFALDAEDCVSRAHFDTQFPLNLVTNPGRPAIWASPKRRAYRQLGRFQEWIVEPYDAGEREGVLRPVRSAAELAALEEGEIGALAALEGMHWVYGDPERIDREIGRLHEADVRMASLTHRFSNALGVGSEDCGLLTGETSDTGLSAQGRAAIGAMIARRWIIDVAHASSETIAGVTDQLIAHAREAGPDAAPVGLVMSHGGVKATCPRSRNVSDDSLRRIALARGVIGLGYWRAAMCWPEKAEIETVNAYIAAAVVATWRAVSDPELEAAYLALWGEGERLTPWRHLALGSDFDGAVAMPFDAAGVPLLANALQNMRCADLRVVEGLGDGLEELVAFCDSRSVLPVAEAPLEAMLGGNVRALMARSLPETYPENLPLTE